MKVDISFADYSNEQHDIVEHLGCQLDSKLSGEALASKMLGKINAFIEKQIPKLKFFYRKSRYLTPTFRRQEAAVQKCS